MAKSPTRAGWVLLILGFAGAAGARPGDVDPEYGAGSGRFLWLSHLFALTDGRLLIADYSAVTGGTGTPHLLVLQGNGRPDPSFGVDGLLKLMMPPGSTWGELLTVAPDGKLLASAYAGGRNQILRFHPEGAPDRGFGIDGRLELEAGQVAWSATDGYLVDRLEVRPDGRILLLELPSKCFSEWSMDCRYGGGNPIVRQLMPDGTPDTAWGIGGSVELPAFTSGWVKSFPLRADGALVVAGGMGELRIVAADGRSVRSVATGVRMHEGTLLPDGRMLFVAASPDWRQVEVVRLLSDAGIDPTFGDGTGRTIIKPDPRIVGDSGNVGVGASGVVASRDGRFVYVQLSVDGSYALYRSEFGRGEYGHVVARLLDSGELDRSFGQEGQSLVAYSFPWSPGLVMDPDDRPLVAGGRRILRLLVDGTTSPGMLSVRPSGYPFEVDESAGTVRINVARLAGRSGAISVRVVVAATGDPGDPSEVATEGQDYFLRTTRLDWADGDDSDRSILLEVREEDVAESTESLTVELVEPTSGVAILESRGYLRIKGITQAPVPNDRGVPVIPSPDVPGVPVAQTDPVEQSAGEGGGSLALELPALLLLWAAMNQRRRLRRRVPRLRDCYQSIHVSDIGQESAIHRLHIMQRVKGTSTFVPPESPSDRSAPR